MTIQTANAAETDRLPEVGDRVIVTGYHLRVMATVTGIEDDGFVIVHRDDMPGYIRTLCHGSQVAPTPSVPS